jgi:hypothetical protein
MPNVVRVYLVERKGGEAALVKTTTQAQALRHVAKNDYVVRAATTLEVIDHMKAGVEVQDVSDDHDTKDLFEGGENENNS